MEAKLLTRATSAVLVTAVGMIAGHVAMPARPTSSWYERAAFIAAVIASGAVAGWREGREAALERGLPTVAAPARWMAGGAALSLVLAAIAWLVVHR